MLKNNQKPNSNQMDTIPKGTRIGDFEFIQLIGEGGYGKIYDIVKTGFDDHYAIKIEDLSTHKIGLQREIRILKECQVPYKFPQFIESGITADFRFLIMELLGPSLSQISRFLPERSFSKYTVLHVGIHMIECIRALHNKGYVHRDIKPSNFLVRPDRHNPICIIDFGLARKYISETGEMKPPRNKPGYTGTLRYASINAHEENELSRKDDLISWFYTMIELSTGSLPWPGSDDKLKTIKIKKNIQAQELCKSMVPEFTEIYNMISSLNFEDEPNYDGIIDLLKLSINNQNFVLHMYDWERLNRNDIAKISVIPLDMKGAPSSETEKDHDLNENGCCNIF